MDLEHRLAEAQLRISYTFRDVTLLRKALKGGDSNSDDREGHRGMAQPGDALINWVIMSEGFAQGLSREQVQTTASVFRSKEMCSQLARAQHFDRVVCCSEREKVPQPTTLKNTLASIVQAVWIDSRDYHEVVRVMTSIGLLNSPVRPEETGPTRILASNHTDGWHEVLGNLDASLEGVDWDALLPDLEIAMPSSPFVTKDDKEHPCVTLDDSELNFNWTRDTYRQDCSDPIVIDPSHEASAISRNVYASNDEPRANAALHNMVRGKPSARQRSHVGKDSARSPGARRVDLVRLVFQSYIRNEQQKFKEQPQLLKQYYGHFEFYRGALSSIATPHSQALARIVIAIGDCSTLPLLKQAIRRARSWSAEESLHVKLHMSSEQRIEAIRHLNVCMAHLRLARLLHIHRLYDESARDVRGEDADRFIVSTQLDWGRSIEGSNKSSRYGNPRNLDKSAISTRMAADVKLVGDSILPKWARHLRRIGQRLQMMISRWGLGVLCLASAGLTDEMLANCTDATFANFLTIIDRFEGDRIRASSDAAAKVIGLFMGDGAVLPTLQLEVWEDKALELVPRLSIGMQKLFTPL